MTKEQLDAIRARLDAATPGPWEHTEDRDVVSTKVTAPMFDYRNEDGSLVYDDMTDYRVASLYYGDEGSHPWHDAELIANAPTDLRALLDEVERLTALRDDLLAWSQRFSDLVGVDGSTEAGRDDAFAKLYDAAKASGKLVKE